MLLRGKKQSYVYTEEEDNYNELGLEISQFRNIDMDLVIRCENLQSCKISLDAAS